MSVRICALVSGKGRGTNFKALLTAAQSGTIDGKFELLASVSRRAGAIEIAENASVETLVIGGKDPCADEKLCAQLTPDRFDLVCLCGYMRILPIELVRAFVHRMMNIHPALIPMFAGKGYYGMRVHEAAIERGVKFSGCTVHFVDEEYDHGPIILQKVTPVYDDDDAESLAARVLKLEHQAYPEAVELFAQGRLQVEGRRVRVLPE